MSIRRVALLTVGGFTPCLSAIVGDLVERCTQVAPEVEIIAYRCDYHSLFTGNCVIIDEEGRKNAGTLHDFGGSPIGSSRVKLTNAKNLTEYDLVKEGVNPLEFAAEQLRKDGVDVLRTISDDDTNIIAADLATYLHENDYELTIIGLPKTTGNNVVPIRRSLGAWTAAGKGAGFASNVIGEHRSNPRIPIIHGCTSRSYDYPTVEIACCYHDLFQTKQWVPPLGLTKERWDVHAIPLPEVKLDIAAEAERLRATMDEQGNVNIFLSEGAGVLGIIAEMEAADQRVQRDSFDHVKPDVINSSQWFAKQFAELIGAEKVMVQKSSYYSRVVHANTEDLALIEKMYDLAVGCALRGESGVVGQDEENNDGLTAIAFPHIAGAKPFNTTRAWFANLVVELGQKVKPAGVVPGYRGWACILSWPMLSS